MLLRPAYLGCLRPFKAMWPGDSRDTDPIMTVGVSYPDLRECREGAPARFLVVCRDSAGEQVARGGEHVMVSIVHKEKKNW